MKKKIKQPGFTLIEILVVIGIIAVLAVIVLVAINPARQFAQSRNTQRTSNVNAILNAIGQRMADNKGTFNGSFTIGSNTYDCPALPSVASTIASSTAITTAKVDLGCLVPTYINTLPFDPSTTTPITALYASASDYYSGYHVMQDGTGRVTVCAYTVESSVGNPPICITR